MSNYVNMNEVFRRINARKAAAEKLKKYVGKFVVCGVHSGVLESVDCGESGAVVNVDGARYGFDPVRLEKQTAEMYDAEDAHEAALWDKEQANMRWAEAGGYASGLPRP